MYCQTIRTVRDISRDDRAIIATYSLRTPTDRLKKNYLISSFRDFVKVIPPSNSVLIHQKQMFASFLTELIVTAGWRFDEAYLSGKSLNGYN